MNSVLSILLFTAVVFSQEASELDRRVMHVASELRCLVCQNQTIAESDAPLAQDLLMQVSDQLAEQLGRGLGHLVHRAEGRAGFAKFVFHRVFPPLLARGPGKSCSGEPLTAVRS